MLLDKSLQRAKNLETVLDIIAKKDYEELQKEILNLKEQINMASYKVEESHKK